MLLLLTFWCVTAGPVDTIINADGSPGPYILGRLFIDTTTITVSRNDSGYLPPYTYLGTVNGLLFSDPIDRGVALHITFTTDFYALPKIYSLFEKRYLDPKDTAQSIADSMFALLPPLVDNGNMTVSGYKSIGVSVGSFGQINLEQGLDIRIGGEIRPGTEIRAHLNDQGTTLDGATREISEFDMIYITLTNPMFSATAGDQYITWPYSGLLDGQKKIKGLSVAVTPKNSTYRIFGALSGGKYTVQTWRGNGSQGPYSFTGSGESGFITPIGGTVQVSVNGKKLEEGPDKEFTVDYDLGSITFTPRILIKNEDLIRAEYEYKLFDYQRTITGTTAAITTPDSTLTLSGVLWNEADSKNHPIELTLAPADIDSLRTSGDRPPFGSTARRVLPNDVPREDALYPLYAKKDTAGAVIFVHKRYNPQKPADVDSFYNVWFRPETAGDYNRIQSANYGNFIYLYAGKGRGVYSPTAPLSAPQRRTTGELQAKLKLPLLKTTLDVAGEDVDKNLFSDRDDTDNRAAALTLTTLAGSRRYDRRSFWIDGNYQFWSARFDREALSAYDRKTAWNDQSLTESSAERQVWQSALGTTLLPGITTELSYGQQHINQLLATDKITNSSRIYPLSWLHLDYQGTYFRHFTLQQQGDGHQQRALAALVFTRQRASLTYRDEWRNDSLGRGTGLLEGSLQYTYEPLNLQESLSFTRFRKSDRGFFASVDTSSALRWEQEISCQPVTWWQLQGTSAFQYRTYTKTENNKHESTLLIDLSGETDASTHGFTTRQHYRTTAEKASMFVQVPIFAGTGLGTHLFDTTLQEYVEHTPGDFYLQAREIFDSAVDMRMRKTTCSFSWELARPEKGSGILRDLALQGSLQLEEQLDAKTGSVTSWIPGYLSLTRKTGTKAKTDIRYADLSYRQDINWSPTFNKEISGRLFATPSLRHIRSYYETGVTTGFSIEQSGNRLTLDNEAAYLTLFRDDTLLQIGDFYLRDLHTTPQETYHVTDLLNIYCRETIGWARQDKPSERSKKRPFSSSSYIQITPGISWRPFGRGWVDGSYTFSQVNLPANLDYRIARGFAAGTSHVISVTADVQTGKHFSIGGSYRGEMVRSAGADAFGPGNHVFSFEVKAYL